MAAAVEEVTERLRTLSPKIEPSEVEPGIFWVDGRGLDLLTPSPVVWGRSLRTAVGALGLVGTVVVGHGRFSTWALARSSSRVRVFEDPAQERAESRAVKLAALGIDPDVLASLAKLGIRSVGRLLELPAGGLLRRFGPEIHRIHRLATGELEEPLNPAREVLPIVGRIDVEPPATSSTRMLFLIKRALPALLLASAKQGKALRALVVGLTFEREGGTRELVLRPAEPTCDEALLLELVRLRLEAEARKGAFERGVEAIALEIQGTPGRREQLQLLLGRRARDRAAAARALARVRAELGEASVAVAVLEDEHFPERAFRWAPAMLDRVVALSPPSAEDEREGPPPPLVRRMLGGPIRVAGLGAGTVAEELGRYRISGRWWGEGEGEGFIDREYRFVRLQRGDLLWLGFDRVRRRWRLWGTVA